MSGPHWPRLLPLRAPPVRATRWISTHRIIRKVRTISRRACARPLAHCAWACACAAPRRSSRARPAVAVSHHARARSALWFGRCAHHRDRHRHALQRQRRGNSPALRGNRAGRSVQSLVAVSSIFDATTATAGRLELFDLPLALASISTTFNLSTTRAITMAKITCDKHLRSACCSHLQFCRKSFEKDEVGR